MQSVISGSRYDQLLEQFGTPAPAVGFVAVIDQLMNALARAEDFTAASVEPLSDLIYENEKLEEAIRQRYRNFAAAASMWNWCVLHRSARGKTAELMQKQKTACW